MNKIKVDQLKNEIKRLFLQANYPINKDLMAKLNKALKEEAFSIAQQV